MADERSRKFIELTAGQPLRGLLVRAAALLSGVAPDLGSGAGGESLLRRVSGWVAQLAIASWHSERLFGIIGGCPGGKGALRRPVTR